MSEVSERKREREREGGREEERRVDKTTGSPHSQSRKEQ